MNINTSSTHLNQQRQSDKQHHLPTVLLVEDSYEGQLLVKHYIKSSYNIVIAPTGEQAISLLKEVDVKAVLMDLHLASNMTGLEATKIIRSMPDKGSLPIIALTAFTMSGIREQCLEAGCTEYIQKPTTKQQLLTLLQKYIHN